VRHHLVADSRPGLAVAVVTYDEQPEVLREVTGCPGGHTISHRLLLGARSSTSWEGCERVGQAGGGAEGQEPRRAPAEARALVFPLSLS